MRQHFRSFRLAILIVFFSLTLTGCTDTTQGPASPSPATTPLAAAQKNGKLILNPIAFPSSTLAPSIEPVPSGIVYPPGPHFGDCDHDNGKPAASGCTCIAFLVQCKDKKCEKLLPSIGAPNERDCDSYPGRTILDQWCAGLGAGQDGAYCLGKPVIYLYPPQPMLVDVTIRTPGKIIVSDPLYPVGGWRQVLAEPSGHLTYQGKEYKELFYESSVTQVKRPTTGLTVKRDQLKPMLFLITRQLGLIDHEQKEFLDFWLPKLEILKVPAIYVSIVDPLEKERIDHVIVSPEPDTRIEFLAYFEPLAQNEVRPQNLILPNQPPKRVGFTMVEWGGTIAPSNVDDALPFMAVLR